MGIGGGLEASEQSREEKEEAETRTNKNHQPPLLLVLRLVCPCLPYSAVHWLLFCAPSAVVLLQCECWEIDSRLYRII
jgi:hypothetical protein